MHTFFVITSEMPLMQYCVVRLILSVGNRIHKAHHYRTSSWSLSHASSHHVPLDVSRRFILLPFKEARDSKKDSSYNLL